MVLKFDVVGVGFGPANLALAIAFSEIPQTNRLRTTAFIESGHEFSWQSELLLPNAKMTTCFWEDLVTARNPRSKYSFINYLKEHNRLFEFMNLRDFYPTRADYTAYLKWCAVDFTSTVKYGTTVNAITLEHSRQHGPLFRLECDSLAGQLVYLTKNAVLAIGRQPKIPTELSSNFQDHVYHTANFKTRFLSAFPDNSKDYRFLIVGAGQSTGDVLQYLLMDYPRARISVILRSFAFLPFDDTPFVNEIFRPDFVDLAHHCYLNNIHSIKEASQLTNYAVIEVGQLRDIYRTIYNETLQGRNRVTLHRFSSISGIFRQGAGVGVSLRSSVTEQIEEIDVDAVLCATGYDSKNLDDLLVNLEPYIDRDSAGLMRIRRDYSVGMSKVGDCKLFIQGAAERSHGPGDPALPIVPTRAAEICHAILGENAADAVAAPIKRREAWK
jgi:L-ornithine N5-oxygenase